MLKRLLSSPVAQTIVGRILGGYMLLVGWTTRWTLINRRAAEEVWKAGGPAVICFWHGRIVLSHFGWAIGRGSQDAKVLISHSREGGIVASATRAVGAGVIRGSTSRGETRKGGAEAMRQMLRHMKGGGAVAIAPDGPRGPRMRAQMGAIQLAKHTGAPIVCLAWATSRSRTFNSWDRFVLPYPFARGTYVWGEPIRVPGHADPEAMEAARAALEAELNRITHLADNAVGAEPVTPAALPEAHAPQPLAAPVAASR
ncbi:MAG: lysophospholipid acyltransferase family protein [Hyphomonadaceae bacterium]|nr:lysophospholipid acyltransferase family protein [Hyphomonadaceae bacterium]